jgi:hypothetical protein
MCGYSGLHILRRFAAYLRLGRYPTPLGPREDATEDPILSAYYGLCDWMVDPTTGVFLFHSPPAPGPNFDHLVQHSDADGLYLPIAFEPVLITNEAGATYTEAIGSSWTLQRECVALASALQLSLDLDPESDEVRDAAEDPAPDGPRWRIFGVESFTCLRLFHACQRSNSTGAAVVFH